MGKIKKYIEKNPELFESLRSDKVFPHDDIMARTVLRAFPRSITPNEITLFRIAATPFVFLLILYGFIDIGIVAFVLVAFTDVIDGSMARTRDQITRFGMLFDPLADKLLIGSMVILLVFQHFDFWLGISILGIEIVLMLTALVAKVKFKTVRAANRWGKLKMILQVAAVFLTLLALLLGFPKLLTYAAGLFGLAIGAAIVSLFAHGV